jgi:hypothetical protein
MPYSESLAERIRQVLGRQRGIEEKKMFGGIGFLLSGNMLVGVWQTSLISDRPLSIRRSDQDPPRPRIRHHRPADEGLGHGRARWHRERWATQRMD